MKTLYIERSTGECRSGNWVDELDLESIDRIVVGIGPGSFAGIRSALAFAQGFALGSGCRIFGLPSPCAIAAKAETSSPLAVVGDARRGKIWVALFTGRKLEREIFQVEKDEIVSAVGGDREVVSPDHTRIGVFLQEIFGERYQGLREPDSEGLKAYVAADPAVLTENPLPIYLNPPVRP